MRRIKVELFPRRVGKKGELKRKRREGFLPVEIYGKGVENIHAFMRLKDFEKLPHGESFLLIAKINGQERLCFLKEVQYGYLGDNPIHVDLLDISHLERIEMELPLEFVGKPIGVEKGGTFEILMHTLSVKADPRSAPEKITVDVSKLDLGDVLKVKDLTLPEEIEVLDEPEENLCVVVEPEEEETEGEGEAQTP